MKRIYLLTVILLATAFTSVNAQVVTLTGTYQGKNLYVQNPFAGNNTDFCTNEVFVNDVKVLTSIQSSAFEIDLSGLEKEDPVTVKITHRENCKPKILNPQVVKSTSNFEISTVNISPEKVTWVTKGEKPRGRFFVEQFRNNSWMTSAEVEGKENPIINHYDIDSKHHSGINKYRIKYLDNTGQVHYSDVTEFQSDLQAIEVYPKRVTDKLYLSREADYELLDQTGTVISKGREKEIDMMKTATGVYYLNVDNQTFKVFKK